MLRTHWMTSSAAAKNYFASTDYYATCPGDWIGKGAEMLGLNNFSNQMHFYSLADNLDPRTGQPLTAITRDGRRVGMDLTFNSTKSVGIARELAGEDNVGDSRIEDAHREAVKYAMGFVEADMQTRVRVGGADHDRLTGNLIAYRVTHRDTRINADDQKPDMSLHDHVFVFNATFDHVEQQGLRIKLHQDYWIGACVGQVYKT
jgi:conjugative relaxase-like TrwC/TraI family protein